LGMHFRPKLPLQISGYTAQNARQFRLDPHKSYMRTVLCHSLKTNTWQPPLLEREN
jgi:hypothetical protein